MACGLGLFLHRFKLGSGLVNWSYDLSLIARGDVLASEAVLVYMDEISHEKLDQPLNAPWDRRLHGRLIERLGNAGAKAVVFDIVFSDPDREPVADATLANAIKTNRCVILGADNVPTGPKSSRFIKPIDALLDSSAGLGSVEVIPDPDLIVRKHTPEPQIPTLSLATLECLGGHSEELAKRMRGERWLNYYGPPNFLPWISYYQALDRASVNDDFFRGKAVFVGARLLTKYAGDRKDEYRNPYSSFLLSQSAAAEQRSLFISGAEIQATMFLNLLRQDWLVRAPFGMEQVFISVAGLLFGFGLARFNPVAAAGLAVGGLVFVCGGAYLLFARNLIWFPWLIVVVQISTALLWSVMFNSIQLYVQKRVYEHTLGIYLSPKLVKKFSGDPTLLQPGADDRMITMFFSDIANFTSRSRNIDSDTLAKFMNMYFHSAVSRCIHPTDGTVVKYIGDGIFAFWNAPDAQPDHAMQACEAALLFREQTQQLLNGEPLQTRIGLHTGIARVGNFGSPERVDYTALGESVNLTSRLEGLNKYLGTECLMTEDTRKLIGDRLVTRALGAFNMKGFDQPVEVFELLGRPDQLEPTRRLREAFAQALNNYRERNLEFATAGFRRVLDISPNDGPSKFYLDRLDELKRQTLPDNWSTSTILREK